MSIPNFLTQDFYPWNLSSEKLSQLLKTHIEHGLTNEEALARIALFGKNVIKESERTPWYKIFFKQLISPVVFILIFAVIFSLILGDTIDALAILLIVILNSIIGFFQEMRAISAIEALKRLTHPKCRVIRNNSIIEVRTDSVAIGDILFLESGDIVATDARIVLCNQLLVNEAILTGESVAVYKSETSLAIDTILSERKNMLFSGTTVENGSVTAIVTATGNLTEIGKIAGLIKNIKTEPTPLEKKLFQISNRILVLVLFIVIIVLVVGLIKNQPWYEVVMLSISLAVAAVPEGLASIVTIAEAIAIRRLSKKNAIIRHLPAVETLGVVNVICTDKTGTLTLGKMEVIDIFSFEQQKREDIYECAYYCNNAKNNLGDSIEIALGQYLKKVDFKIKNIGKKIKEWSFESKRKMMSVAIITNNNENQVQIFVKGAPEAIISKCNLTDNQKRELEELIEKFSIEGKKVLALAKRDFDYSENFSVKLNSEIEVDLVFLGLVTFSDPVRLESYDSIKKCNESNIKVVMITGDHPLYAKQIATKLGIIKNESRDLVMTGHEISKLEISDLKMKLPLIKVFARVSPEDKLTIIKCWKELGAVVAMTGDGVNDAPALKAASIGISMGKSGTEVAKEASSMVIADDNFATIVSAIEEGRHIFGNISRTIKYLITGNLSEIFVILVATLLGYTSPLFPIHLLWINLITDGLPAIALVLEPLPKDILKFSRRPSPKSFFTKRFYADTVFMGIINTCMFVFIYIVTLKMYGSNLAQTYIFNLFVFEELLRSFTSRSDTKTIFSIGLKSNLTHFFAVMIPIIFQFIINRSTFLRDIFKITRISDLEFVVLILFALIPVTMLEMRKKIIFKKRALIKN